MTTRIYCAALLALFVGCASSDEASNPSEQAVSSKRTPSSGLLIKDDVLRSHGMRSLLQTEANLQTSIDQMWSCGGDLYVTSRTGGRTTLFKLSGDALLTEWTFELEGPLEFAPTVYEYPRELAGENPRELWLVQNNRLYGLDDNEGLLVFGPIDVAAAVTTSVSADTDRVFVGTVAPRLFAYDKRKGTSPWQFLANGFISAPSAVGGVNVYVGDESGSLFKLNAGNGFQSGDSDQFKTGGRIVVPPAYYIDRIYVGSHDYKVYCFDEFRLLERWNYPAGAPISEVTPFRDDVYAVSIDTRRSPTEYVFHSINRANGRLRWDRAGLHSMVAADPEFVYALDGDGNVARLRAEDGTVASVLDMSGIDFVVGQSAEFGTKRADWGKFFIATKNGRIQCVLPSR